MDTGNAKQYSFNLPRTRRNHTLCSYCSITTWDPGRWSPASLTNLNGIRASNPYRDRDQQYPKEKKRSWPCFYIVYMFFYHAEVAFWVHRDRRMRWKGHGRFVLALGTLRRSEQRGERLPCFLVVLRHWPTHVACVATFTLESPSFGVWSFFGSGTRINSRETNGN